MEERVREIIAGLKNFSALKTKKGVAPAQLDRLAKKVKRDLPSEYRIAMTVSDGLNSDGFEIFDCRQSLKEYRELLEDNDESADEDEYVADDRVRDGLWHPGRIPLAADLQLFLDLVPGPRGTAGQIIAARDESECVPVAENFIEFLDYLLDLRKAEINTWDERFGFGVITSERRLELKTIADRADPDRRKNRNALVRAGRAGDMREFRKLAELGVPIDAYNSEDQTALYGAVLDENLSVMRELLEAGVNPDLGEKRYGTTPLLRLAYEGNVEGVELLLRYGANASLPDHHNANAVTQVVQGAPPGAISLLDLFARAGVDINNLDGNQSLPLHEAAQGAKTELVRWLLEHGSKTDLVDSYGCTPLHYACECYDEYDTEHAAVVEMLIAAGAHLEIQNFKGTPLHIAAMRGAVRVVKALLRAGAPLDAVNNDGKKPEDVAEKPEVRSLLSGKSG